LNKVVEQKVEKNIVENEQKPLLCYYCTESLNGDSVYYNGKIYHRKCYRAAVAKSNGKPFVCPKCNGSGTEIVALYSLKENETVNNKTCSCTVCGGVGYTSTKIEATVVEKTGYKEAEKWKNLQ